MRTAAVVIALLGVVLAGCEAAATPSVASVLASPTSAIALGTASPTTPAAATPRPTPSPTHLAPPPPPTAVRITRQGCYAGSDSTGIPPGKCITTITWKTAATKGTEIQVYGVTGCLSLAERAGDGSCLVKHTPVPSSARKLIAKAPASKGKIVWSGPGWRDLVQADTGGPTYRAYGVDRHGDDIYFAIVLAAYSAAGQSKFVIADAGTWCYDTGCEGWGP